MAEKDGIKVNDSNASELPPLEEIDLNDQIEIIPVEEDTGEPVEVMQEEVVDDEVEDKSDMLDSAASDELEDSSVLVDEKPELSSKKTETGNSSESTDDPKTEQSDLDENEEGDFLSLDYERDDEIDDESPKEQGAPQVEVGNIQENAESEKKSQGDDQPGETQPDHNDVNGNSINMAKRSKAKIPIRIPSPIHIIVGLVLLLLSFTGGVFYVNPSLLGFKKEPIPVPTEIIKPAPIVATAPQQDESPKPPTKRETYLAGIRNAGLLRDRLLAKKEEIYHLKRHYQKGIADLEKRINQELQKEGITTYPEGLKNRRIELNLRTIQRRLSYIKGLEKPTQWIKQGTEELLYLKRKAEIDLQLIDVAGGIDMEHHMRHLTAAIEKYRPSAQKLAVNRENTDLTPLEAVWGKLNEKEKTTVSALSNVTDEVISEEVCRGNYARTAELTSISAATAQCLSKINGPDLFLNGLTTLSPEAAKNLFQWRGNWICMNGIKKLSPAAAQYLFKWKGSWISLNGITEFPSDLATYLMGWEGKQLELMGLRYNNKNADQKALKYLALWEIMGGKLFISDEVRKEIERVLM